MKAHVMNSPCRFEEGFKGKVTFVWRLRGEHLQGGWNFVRKATKTLFKKKISVHIMYQALGINRVTMKRGGWGGERHSFYC